MANEISVDNVNKERAKKAKKCTLVGFAINTILSIFKIIAGVVGRSGAMIADGIHSLSDSITDVVVIIFVDITARGQNDDYRYGHGKFETFATLIISVALVIVAVILFVESGTKVIASLNGETIASPSYIALVMAIISIVVKEYLYQYTLSEGKKIESMALVANAWHHRSDAFSSIATLIGISGAMFLAPQWRILDPIAAMAVSIFVAIVAVKLAMPAVKELLEVSLPDEVNKDISNIIISVDGVKTFHRLRTRKNGNLYIIDFHIKVDPEITITQAHNIATEVEKKLGKKYGECIINVHTEPFLGDNLK